MAAPLMVTISGIRGIAGKSFTPAVVASYVASFAQLQRKKAGESTIIVGRDSRVSGPWVTCVVHGVLLAMGYNVVDLGIVPTPTVQYLVITRKAAGGIVITSSHNPIEWNGLKFVENDGLFLSPEGCAEMFKIAASNELEYPSQTDLGKVEHYPDAIKDHIDAVLALPCIDTNLVAARKLKVCLDTVNGAGGPIMKQLLEKFGCTVIALNNEPNGKFAHTPEPIPENLTQLCDAVKEHKADLGVATDPDVDRCVFIDETGKPIGEEYTLALAVEFWLGVCNKRGVICKNLSSSRANDDIAKKYGCTCEKTAVGEINVAQKMLETKAVIGGEGNGGVMLPDIHIGRDAPVAAALVLALLARHEGSLGSLKASLPQWEIVKMKVPAVGINAEEVIEKVKNEWESKATVSTIDGVHIETEEYWVHLRKSNTEPIIRVIAEAHTVEIATEVCKEFMRQLTGSA